LAVYRREFHRHDEGDASEWHVLARETKSGRLYVEHGWSRPEGAGTSSRIEEVDLSEFLARSGHPQTLLRKLLGSLVRGPDGF
jgi:hypothetical protein